MLEKRENLIMAIRSDLSEVMVFKPSPNNQAAASFAKSRGKNILSGVTARAKALKEDKLSRLK